MAYQLYKKLAQYTGRRISPTEISITQNSFGVGPKIAEELKKDGFVEIYVDKENNKIGFKATKNSETGFKVQHKKVSSILYVTAKSITNGLVKARYPAVKEGDMWVITVPNIEHAVPDIEKEETKAEDFFY